MSTCDIWSPQNGLISPEDGVIKLCMCEYKNKFCSVVLQKEGTIWLRITLTKNCIFTKSAFCKMYIFLVCEILVFFINAIFLQNVIVFCEVCFGKTAGEMF